MTTSTDRKQEPLDLNTPDCEETFITTDATPVSPEIGDTPTKDMPNVAPISDDATGDEHLWVSQLALSDDEISELTELQNESPWLSLEEVRELASLRELFPWMLEEVSDEPFSGLLSLGEGYSEIDSRLSDINEEDLHSLAELMAGIDISADQLS